MLGVCFRNERRPWLQDQWSWLFSNFGVTNIWQRGADADSQIYQPTTDIQLADELPVNVPLIVIAPPDGQYVRGDESLLTFIHPVDAIYLFGASHYNVSVEEDLGARVPDATVYIPTVKHEMFSHTAAYVVLYDRFVKRGGMYG